MLNVTELRHLAVALMEEDVQFESVFIDDGLSLDGGTWCATMHSRTYGGKQGLIEVYCRALSDVVGWCRAEDAILHIRHIMKNGYIDHGLRA